MAMQLYGMKQRVEQCRASMAGARNSESLQLTTPDGCVLDGMLLRSEAPSSKGCVIYLGGNGEYGTLRNVVVALVCCQLEIFAGEFFELNQAMRVWTQQGYSVLLFNYRGVGNSTGLLLRHGPVIDTCTMIAYATKVLAVPENRIILFGHSIGGAFATEAAQLWPQVFLVNDRSFGTLSRVGLFHILLNAVVGPAAKSTAALLLRYAFVQTLRHVVCFELDSVARWQSISGSRKLCVYTDEDKVIPIPSQLARMVLELNVPHDHIGCFMRMDRRSSADAHNIELSSSEYRRVFAAIDLRFSGTALPDSI
jgi:pimeloyl-ACP methyl ester carboxylesterase